MAQNIPSEYFLIKHLNILHDLGYAWNTNTIIKPYRWSHFDKINGETLNHIKTSLNIPRINWLIDDIKNEISIKDSSSNKNKESLHFKTIVGMSTNFSNEYNPKYSNTIYTYFNLNYSDQYKLWFYPRITSNGSSLKNFTGKKQPNSRFGFNSGEVDMAGFGYFGSNLKYWYGRGRNNWGAFPIDNLALSDNSGSYDHFSTEFHTKYYKLRYFHGYLETLEYQNHRYMLGKILEFRNNSNFLIGIQELVIYSGINRPLDLSYLNPISSHLEVELNNRDNESTGAGGQNALWQISTDFIPSKSMRLSFNILIDELALDKKNINQTTGDTTKGTNHLGIQGRILYTKAFFDKFVTSFYFDYLAIGTYAFRHGRGANNFALRGKPIGNSNGSDIEKFKFNIRTITPWRLIGQLSIHSTKVGDESIIDNLYNSYLIIDQKKFPSGEVDLINQLDLNILYLIKPNTEFKLFYTINDSNISGRTKKIGISINYYFKNDRFIII